MQLSSCINQNLVELEMFFQFPLEQNMDMNVLGEKKSNIQFDSYWNC